MKIGELSEATGISSKAIRFYEETGLLPKADREFNGYRSYSQDSVDKLQFVQRAKAAGLSLNEIKRVMQIRSDGKAPCVHVSKLLRRHLQRIEEQLDRLAEAKSDLEKLAARAELMDPASCDEGAICSIFGSE